MSHWDILFIMKKSSRRLILYLLPVLIIISILIFTGISREYGLVRRDGIAKVTNTDISNVTTVDVDGMSQSYEVHSPDGEMNLIMRATANNSEITYTFSVEDKDKKGKKTIFTKSLSQEFSMSLPPNSWSPDNKYVFIKQTSPQSFSDYFVFKADGEPFAGGEEYISVVPAFNSKVTNYTLSEVTGWDSPSLLHIFTDNGNNEQGPSYWFGIPGGWTSQLSHR